MSGKPGNGHVSEIVTNNGNSDPNRNRNRNTKGNRGTAKGRKKKEEINDHILLGDKT